ncbi:hypothetical protein CC1G_00681 [Coprinopsis cinerea okayama7|uniref:Uncharacterized protein n=1 Tax=Coprinopsis cinerea (strain Okayama-7 / 130 / ATCC MYA-4618 / FGSC 9003) TaxID=240176 RepID=A8N3N6_COPC7|nr:hypothetical protein CC1G_00681 [Coprinopsis cinerea okayama7\|eukprot:XP_001829502.1 hypothetical protein CC1G_00681 [Coprinopsis cinerea okayama7\
MTFILLSAGSNAQGQLGHSENEDAHTFHPCLFHDQPPGSLPNGPSTRVLEIAAGANHTLALLEKDENTKTDLSKRREIWACGDGRRGQLGPQLQDSSRRPRTDIFRKLEFDREGLGEYHPKAIAAGWETSYVVMSSLDPTKDDICFSFGSNDFGDLGTGEAATSTIKRSGSTGTNVQLVSFSHLRVDGKPLSQFGPLRIESLVASQHHVAAILRANETRLVVGWGASRHGQVGLVEAVGPKGKVKPIAIIDRPRIISVDDPHDPLVTLSVGSQHTVVLHASGKVAGFGSNRKGQLNLGGFEKAKNIGCTWNGTFGLVVSDEGNSIYGVGSDTHGQLGRGEGVPGDQGASQPRPADFPESIAGHRPLKLSCGTEHVLSLWTAVGKEETEVWGWGWNEHGNLGLGSTDDIHRPTKIWPREGTVGTVVDIWTGSGTSWILCKK